MLSRAGRGTGRGRLPASRSARLLLELLEDRCVPSTVRFVTPTGSGDGSSWANAASLQSALTAAASGDQIWVEEGTYKPTTGTDRTVFFKLKDGVAVYGGFVGTETQLSERNWVTHVTTLSGDIGTANDKTDNSYHVVDTNGVSASAILDGFTITAGNANGTTTIEKKGGGLVTTSGSVTLKNLIVTGNSAEDAGGGMYSQTASPTLTNVTFRGNTSGGAGGGMDVNGNSPTLTNVVFDNNSSDLQGGGMANFGSSTPILFNVTFSRNSSSAGGGLYDNTNSVATLTNCILWGNTGSAISGIATVSYSDVQGGWSGTGNIDADPRFVDAANGDLSLSRGSPAIDTGTNTGAPSFDRDNLSRPVQSTGVSPATTDMGAYEFQGLPPSASLSTVNFASPTVASGSTDIVTLVIKDTAGAAITGLSDSNFSFSLSGGTSSTGTFGSVSETGTPGTYQATFTGVLAGTAATLTVEVTGVNLDDQPTVTVTAGPVDAAQSSVSFATATVASGSDDLVTVILKDAAGNSISGKASSINLSLNSGGGVSTGTFGSVTETGTPGTYQAHFTGVLAGTAATLTTQADGVTLDDQPTVTVTVGPVSAAQSSVSFASPSVPAGNDDLITVVLKDAAGNSISGQAASIYLSLSTGSGVSTGTFSVVTETGTPGTYQASFTGNLAGTAANLTAQVSSVPLNDMPTVTVTPAAAVRFVINGPPTTKAGKPFTFTVRAVDAFGNTAAFSGRVRFRSNDPRGVLPTLGALTAGSGTFRATLKTVAGGDKWVRVRGALAGAELTLRVQPAAASALVFARQPSTAVAGVALKPQIVVRILDAYGNLTNSNALVTIRVLASDHDQLHGTLTRRAHNGIVVFSDLKLTGDDWSVRLQVVSPRLQSAVSANIIVAPIAGVLPALVATN